MRNGELEDARLWLFWDGECEFCRRCVAWVERRDRQARFRPLPYQQAPSPPMTDSLRAACRASVQVIAPDGRLLGGGAAVAFILGEIGYRRLRWIMTRPVLRILVECGYRFVARHRRWIGRLVFGKSCRT